MGETPSAKYPLSAPQPENILILRSHEADAPVFVGMESIKSTAK